MTKRALVAVDDEQPEPIARQVPGGPKLRRWLRDQKPKRKTQLWLAEQTGIGQQLISAYCLQVARPQVMSSNALRIQTATDGAITVWDWMTAKERAKYRKADAFGLSEKV